MPKSNQIGGKAGFGGGGQEATHADTNGHLNEYIRDKEGARILGQPVNIFEIAPDETQPRRQIPSLVRQGWDGRDTPWLFDRWIDLVAAERNSTFETVAALVREWLDGMATDDPEAYKPGVMQTALREVAQLAQNIRDNGLRNPISISENPDGEPRYFVETGERRWLAHHLLHLTYQDAKWAKIPAQKIPAMSVWAQASENTQRLLLTAIAKARQLAKLVIALYEERGHRFEPYHTFAHDRHYYAQVADGRMYEVPRDERPRVLAAMGVKSESQIRQFRMLLNLPDSVWTLADDYDITESWLRGAQSRSAGSAYNLMQKLELELDRRGVRMPQEVLDHMRDSLMAVALPEDEEVLAGHSHDVTTVTFDDGIYPATAGLPDELFDPATPDEDSEPANRPPFAPVDAGTSLETPSWLDEQRVNLPSDPVPEVSEEEKEFLKWTYTHANRDAKRVGWFSAYQVNKAVDLLNAYVERGLLEAQDISRKMSQSAFYRIAPGGCRAIGQQPQNYNAPMATVPNNGGASSAGRDGYIGGGSGGRPGNGGGGSGSSGRGSGKSEAELAAERERAQRTKERRVMSVLDEMERQIRANEKAAIEDISIEEYLREAHLIFDRIQLSIEKMRDRLHPLPQ